MCTKEYISYTIVIVNYESEQNDILMHEWKRIVITSNDKQINKNKSKNGNRISPVISRPAVYLDVPMDEDLVVLDYEQTLCSSSSSFFCFLLILFLIIFLLSE